MIPASAEYDVPSAGDEAIFGEILRSLGRDAGPVTAVLQMRDAEGPFADIDPQRRDAIAARLRETGGGALAYLYLIPCYFTKNSLFRCVGNFHVTHWICSRIWYPLAARKGLNGQNSLFFPPS